LLYPPTSAAPPHSHVALRPKYSEATARGNIVPPHCFIDMFLLLLLRDLHGLTTPWEILSGDNIAENDYCRERARDVSRKNFLFYHIFSLLTLPKKSAFGKVTWLGKRRLLPQMTASLYLGHIGKSFPEVALVRKTICFLRSMLMHDLVIGLFINSYDFRYAV
jgi:hypothetical protein